MVNSIQKGKAGERELSAFLRERGWEARRGQQFSGGDDSPDIVHSIPDVHIECKRTERALIYDWMEQAKRDANGKLPLVAHRRSRGEWLAIMPLENLLDIFTVLETYQGRKIPDKEQGQKAT